jgi:HEAT repeat protein
MSSEVLEPALSQALKEDPEAYWAAVREVRLRDPESVFAALEPLAESEDPLLRQLVPDVLRGMPPLVEKMVALFKEMLASEDDAGVLDAIAAVFTEVKHASVVELLLPITKHELPELRLSAMQGLVQALEQVMDRFIALAADQEGEVRSWALFALSALVEVRPQHVGVLREVFVAHMNDPHAEAKAESVLGLARCSDRRALDPVAIGLRAQVPMDQYVDAAKFLIGKGIGADVLRRALSKI